MDRIRTNPRRDDGASEFDRYRSMADELRAKAMANLLGSARVVVFNGARAPLNRNPAG